LKIVVRSAVQPMNGPEDVLVDIDTATFEVIVH